MFVGQSGVGKSSLLNALDGEAAAKTGAVRDGDGRGRHTTTASALYDLPGGIRVIDTPGIRRFSVEDADGATLAAGFTEIAAFAAECRFRDCTHVHEPGCAVRRAVADGAVPRSRYVSYRQAARRRRRRPATPAASGRTRAAARPDDERPADARRPATRDPRTAPPGAYARRGRRGLSRPRRPPPRHSARSTSRATNSRRCSESHAGSTSRCTAGRGPVIAKRAAPALLAETEW